MRHLLKGIRVFLFLTILTMSSESFAQTLPDIKIKDLGEMICSYTNKGHEPVCLKDFLADITKKENVIQLIVLGCRFSVNIGREDCFFGMIQKKSIFSEKAMSLFYDYIDANIKNNTLVTTECSYEESPEDCYADKLEHFIKLKTSKELGFPKVIF